MWSSGESDTAAKALCLGFNYVTVTYNTNCQIVDSVEILSPNIPMILSFDTTFASCNTSDAQAVVAVTGGLAPYSYIWSNSDADSVAENIGVGIYQVTVSDANGCSVSDFVTISDTSSLTLDSIIKQNITCVPCAGSLEVILSGGAAPYTYLWNDGGTANPYEKLCVGTYTVTVFDANMCQTVVQDSIIIENQLIGVISEIVAPSCTGSDNGTALIEPTGGSGVYLYEWSSGETTQRAGSLISGWNFVTVTDGTCSYFDSVLLDEPSDIELDITVADAKCFGEASGSLEVTVINGVAPDSYLWSDGQTAAMAQNLAAGIYNVTVTYGTICSSVISDTVKQPEPLVFTFDSISPSCSDNNGTLWVVAQGGTAPYTYSWNLANMPDSVLIDNANDTIANLGVDIYYVSITDSNACMYLSSNITLLDSANLQFSELKLNHITCLGRNDASAEVFPEMSSTHSYLWWSETDGYISTDTSSTDFSGKIENLSVGNYKVYFVNEDSCKGVASFAINDNFVLKSTFVDTTSVSCYSGNDGAAEVRGVFGKPYDAMPTYRYLWSNGDTTSIASGLLAEKYFVTITDSSSCSVVDSIVIPQPELLKVSFAKDTIQTICYANTLDSLTIDVVGGTAPYSYKWSNGQNTETAVTVPVGTITVTVTDVNACLSLVDSIYIWQGGEYTASFDTTFTSCGDSVGTATVSITGGTSPFNYLWSNADTTATADSLWVDYHIVTVTDNKGCILVDTVAVTDTSSIAFTVETIGSITCAGYAIGKAQVTDTVGGVGNYSVLWSNGDTRWIADTLSLGIYHVKVFDSNQCTGLGRGTVDEDSVLRITNEFKLDADISCDSIGTGTAEVSVLGGVRPYSYLWSNGDVTKRADSLSFGWNYITVTDAKNCVVSDSVNIPNDQLRVRIISQKNVSCYGYNDGEVRIIGAGSLGGYKYLWSTGDTDTKLDSLSAGLYLVTLTSDFSDCSIVDTIVITQPNGVKPVFTTVKNPGCIDSSGVLSMNVSGGIRPLMYQWSTGDNDTLVTNLWADYHSVTITDANGCIFDTTIRVIDGEPFAIEPGQRINIRCFGISNGQLEILASNGTEPYTYSWSHDSLLDIEVASGLGKGVYSIIVADSNKCWRDYTFDELIEPDSMRIVFDTSKVIECYGERGEIIVHVIGGSGDNTYEWTTFNGVTTTKDSILSSASAGYYKLKVTDFRTCSVRDSIFYLQPAPIEIKYSRVMPGCRTRAYEGELTLDTISGPGAPFRFNWENDTTTVWYNSGEKRFRDSLEAGEYGLVVYDSIGKCSQAYSFRLDPSLIDGIAYSYKIPRCDFYTAEQLKNNEADGFISIDSIYGGVPEGELVEYVYRWAHLPSGLSNTPLLTSLNKGKYAVEITPPSDCPRIFEIDSLNAAQIYFKPGIASFDETDKVGSKVCLGDSIQLKDWTSVWFHSDYKPDLNTKKYYNWFYDTAYTDLVFNKKDTVSPWVTPLSVARTDSSYVKLQTSYDGCYSDTAKFLLTHHDLIGLNIQLITEVGEVIDDSTEIMGGVRLSLQPEDEPWFVSKIAGDLGFNEIKYNSYSTAFAHDSVVIDAWIHEDYYKITGNYAFAIEPEKSTYYIAEGRTTAGCLEYDTVFVRVIPDIFISSGITPNDDGINDTWVIPYLKLCPSAYVSIFNRWGIKVYEDDKDYHLKPFEGKNMKGKDLPIGTYYYYIEFNDGKGTEPETGSITIIR
ncbi:MAG: gliding motility-associated C-terminal domain-containing protein [Bacteroidales bacterium]|nr:gliding motility-associated C-terminal domain-containing protein [Bacteroidales bacterium]